MATHGITQCYLLPSTGDTPTFTPANWGRWYSIYRPWRDARLSWLNRSVIHHSLLYDNLFKLTTTQLYIILNIYIYTIYYTKSELTLGWSIPTLGRKEGRPIFHNWDNLEWLQTVSRLSTMSVLCCCSVTDRQTDRQTCGGSGECRGVSGAVWWWVGVVHHPVWTVWQPRVQCRQTHTVSTHWLHSATNNTAHCNTHTHTHTVHLVTLWPSPFDLKVNAFQATAMHWRSTNYTVSYCLTTIFSTNIWLYQRWKVSPLLSIGRPEIY